jgi:hypothetical protein
MTQMIELFLIRRISSRPCSRLSMFSFTFFAVTFPMLSAMVQRASHRKLETKAQKSIFSSSGYFSLRSAPILFTVCRRAESSSFLRKAGNENAKKNVPHRNY